jgi:site-specific DNA recombinase
VVAAEKNLVKEAVRRVLAQDSLYAISKDWNERGVPTVTGASWSPKTLQQILLSGRIAGFRDHRGEQIASKQWKPLVKVADWNSVRTILIDKAKRRTRVARSYLLGQGLLRCGECGGKLVAAPRRNRAGEFVPRYSCRKDKGGCGRVSAPAEPIEAIISSDVIEALSDPDFVARLGGGGGTDDAEAYRAELAELEASLEEASRDFYVDKMLTRPEFVAVREALVPKLDAARAALAASTRRRPSALLSDLDDISVRWDSLGLDRQRALIEMCMESVTVDLPKVKRQSDADFDSSRLRPPLWRA